MKPPKKRKPKARKEIQAAQTADAIREPLQPMLAHGRSLSDFEPLMVAEQMLLHACRMGEIAVISKHRPEQATEENTVRAAFLRFLLLGGDARAPIHEQGVTLNGAWIKGALDLDNTSLSSPIACRHSHFSETISLQGSTVPAGIFLEGSFAEKIAADSIIVAGNVCLNDGFESRDTVRLNAAEIKGHLNCISGTFRSAKEIAITMDNAIIKGSVFFRHGFSAHGEVRLIGAIIDGTLDLSGAILEGKEFDSLSADGARIGGAVFMHDEFLARGTISFNGAIIGGYFDCRKCKIDGNNSDSILCNNINIKGNAIFNNEFTAKGDMYFLDAKIGGYIDFSSAEIKSHNYAALLADRIEVNGSAFLEMDFLQKE